MQNQKTASSEKAAALFIAILASFLAPFMMAAINIAMPVIGREFSLDAVTLNWVLAAYSLTISMCMVPFGRLADIHGRKKIFIIGMYTYAASSLLISIVPSAPFLIGLRIIQGAGASMTLGTSLAILTSVYSPGERGKAIGFSIAAVYLGLSMGPLIGGLLTQYLGWRSIFIVNAALCALLLIAVQWKLKGEWAEARGEKFDLAGSLIFGIGLALLIYGFSILPQVTGIILVISGIAVLTAFVIWEMRNKSPVLDISLFRNNMAFSMSNLAALINYMATAAIIFLLSLYLQYIKALTPDIAGLVLIAQPIVMTIISPLAGRLSDKIEPRVVASLGMSFTFAGLVMLAFLNKETTIVYIIVCMIVLGVGFGLFSSPNTNAVMSAVDKKYYGVASATVNTMRTLGQTLSMGISLLVFTLYMGNEQITPVLYPQFITSVNVVCIICSALCFLGIFASLARGKTHS